jgi:hypothetical protein
MQIQHANLWQAIFWSGLTAGAMDITAACLHSGYYGRGPIWLLQIVAGGLLGRENSLQGGLKTAALGLFLHFFIAFVWAALYCAVSLKLPLLTDRAVLSGVLYGLVVYLFMYTVVRPLSALHLRFFDQTTSAMLIAVLIHICCVGLPIALTVRWRAQ